MSLPTKDEIVQAIEQVGALKAPQLSGYQPCPGLLGPESYSGGFCIAFPFTNGKDKKAVRVWHQEIENIKQRYLYIAKDIRTIQSPYLCDVEFVSDGLDVNGTSIDLVIMDWIEGLPLKMYIQDILNNGKDEASIKIALQELANKLLAMFQHFHALGFSHGDLQHDNILVQNDGTLKVIDYDCFYTPSMGSNFEQTTSGYNGYQHPTRFTHKLISNEKTDYFSELVLYLSVKALAANKNLWSITEDSDFSFLFTEDDFRDLGKTSIYKEISSLGEDHKELADILCDYLKEQDINRLQPFYELQLQSKVQFFVSVSKAIRDKQTIDVNWKIPFEANVSLCQKGNNAPISNERDGNYSCVLSNDATFILSVTTKDGRNINKEISVLVFDECEIDFSADKYYIFPTIPVTLTWMVRNAKRVWLDKEEVEATGSKVIEPQKEVSVILSAEDEFGVKEKRIDIGMLPIPQVKALLVPTPEIVNNMSLTIKQPRYNVDVKFPTIDIDWIRAEVPKVPSLTELDLNVKLSPLLPKVNLMSSIKKVFNHIIRK